ncbi:MAG: beta-phosphoglucomutase [Bacillaceae bacterium]
MTKEVKAFIFDLDGVITDTAEYHFLAWQQLGKDLGIDFDREFNETLKGVDRMESLNRILRSGNRENDFTQEEKEALATKKNNHYVTFIERITEKDILPNIEQLLKDLKENNYKIALASASKNAIPVLERLGLLSYFDHVVNAAEVAKSKPDPEVFLKGAAAVGVDPSECIGVEDAEAGVEAIKSAGMYAVAIGDAAILSRADYIVSATSELTLQSILDAYQK